MLLRLKKNMKDQRGLTLIELLAVIVILGIIAAIAVPSIGNVINHTKDKAVVAEGVQIINAAKLYVSEHGTDDATITEITSTILAPYVDNLKDSDFTVKVSKDGNKTVYKLVGHNSATVIDSKNDDKTEISEDQLLGYK